MTFHGSSSTAQSSTLRTTTVGRGTVEATSSASGTVVSPRTLQIAFAGSGKVSAIPVHVGQLVHKGQKLATMTESGTGDTVVMHSPMRGMVSTIDGAVGPDGRDDDGDDHGDRVGGTELRLELQHVLLVHVGRELVTVVQAQNLQVRAYFSEADIVNVRRGRAATLTFDVFPGRTIRGRVAEIDPTSTVSNNVVQYGVTLSLRNQPASLRPGQTATVQIVTARATNALYVPSAAVQTAGGQSTVTVLRDGKQVIVAVQLGVQGDQTTQILSGLTQGERVVIPTATTGGGFPGGGFPRIGGFGGGFGGGGGGAAPGGGGGG